MRRRVLLAALLAAPLALPGSDPAAAQRAASVFAPEVFFAGRTRSEGVLTDTTGQPAGRFRGDTVGRREADGSTTFDQTIRMSDGTVTRRSFRLVRTSATGVQVTGSQVVGTARGVIDGRTFSVVSYIRPEPDNPFSELQFDQTMTLAPDGRSVRNVSEIRKLGFPVRRADETFVGTGGGRRGR